MSVPGLSEKFSRTFPMFCIERFLKGQNVQRPSDLRDSKKRVLRDGIHCSVDTYLARKAHMVIFSSRLTLKYQYIFYFLYQMSRKWTNKLQKNETVVEISLKRDQKAIEVSKSTRSSWWSLVGMHSFSSALASKYTRNIFEKIFWKNNLKPGQWNILVRCH